MGDRILLQVVEKDEKGRVTEFSPVAYGHWAGSYAPDFLARLQTRMVGREGDVSYTFARLIQEMTDGNDDNLSFGCWNADKVLVADDSHGEAGVVIIDATKDGLRFNCKGGYLKASKDGLSVSG